MMNFKEIQSALLSLGIDPGAIDGVNGPKSRAAVMAFQSAYGLVDDGIAGPQTQAALKQATTALKPGRAEPDKSAMADFVPGSSTYDDEARRPANAGTLVLRSTARQIDEIIIHCAATPEGKDFTVDDVRAWHKQRGWSDIGYHYVVYRDGRVLEGRPVGQTGAHVEGRNTGTVGVCYIGGVSADGKAAKDTRTPEQRASLLWLVGQLAYLHRAKRISGHNQYAAKACPSFDVRRDKLGALPNN